MTSVLEPGPHVGAANSPRPLATAIATGAPGRHDPTPSAEIETSEPAGAARPATSAAAAALDQFQGRGPSIGAAPRNQGLDQSAAPRDHSETPDSLSIGLNHSPA